MKNMIKELWHGNICPQTDSRNNSPEMKELMEYMARHHDDLLKTMTDEQKEIFEKWRFSRNSIIVGASIQVLQKKPYLPMPSSSVQNSYTKPYANIANKTITGQSGWMTTALICRIIGSLLYRCISNREFCVSKTKYTSCKSSRFML